MNKSVIVTGASRGIGAQIAKDFAKEGYNVLINYNNSEKQAIEVKKEINKNFPNVIAEIYKCDVSCLEECERMADFAISIFGKIDVLVANAGVAQIKPLIDVSEGDINKLIGVNLLGVVNACKAASGNMISNMFGKIITISSMWGLSGSSCEVLYSAAKAGVIGLTKALSKELGPSNITVNCICPGLINTEMNSSLSKEVVDEIVSSISLGRIGQPKDISNVALFLASDKASYVTGATIQVDGGIIL